jgi:Flp pilus assembly protein CpaB
VAAEPILAGEQISTARFREGQQVGGGVLGIPKGDVAVTVPLPASKVVGGVVGQGDHVVVYGTFDQDSQDKLPAQTVTLVPSVQVLKVVAPSTSGSVVTAASSSNADTMVTVALSPADAARVVFAQEQGSVWLALVPPQQAGVAVAPVSEKDVVAK